MIVEQAQNLGQVFLAAMDTYPERTCFQVKWGGHYQNIFYRHFQSRTFRLVRFFHNQGIVNGERVVLAVDNSLEWMEAYVACLLSGGVIVPARVSLTSDALHFILKDTDAQLVILQDQAHIQAITASLSLDDSEPLPSLQTILVVHNQGASLPEEALSMETIFAERLLTQEEETIIRAHTENIAPQDFVSIHYVPGQAGDPKGVVFDHTQWLATMHNIAEWLTFDEDDLAFTSRPWSEHSSLITAVHYFLSGITNTLRGSYETVQEDMRQTSPTLTFGIPYSLEIFYEACMTTIAEQPEDTQKVFQWALAKGKEYRAAGSAASPELRQEFIRADMTFFSQFRGEAGGRLRRNYSTGGSISREIADFFEAVGPPVLNTYGLVEAGGFPAVSRPDAYRHGSCGQAAPGFEVRIADDNEILVRGETVMRQYWNRSEEIEQTFDADGWLRTGDVGRLDEDGYLYITDRKRHIMVMSTGYKFNPLIIESALMSSPFIAQAAVFGEGKPYISAMIVPNLEALAEHFQDAEEAVPTTAHPKVKALLDKVIGEINSQLDHWEYIREYSLLEQPLTQDAGELTSSMKISRHVVAKRYATQITAMYPVTLQLEAEEVFQVQVEPERLRELLEKERILDAWMADAGIEFLFDLAAERKIDQPSMVHICDVAASIAQMENEEKPLSTALIVGDPARIGRVLKPSQIRLLHHDHIRRMRKTLVTMARMVDGLVLGYVVDKHGYVRGINKLTVEMKDEPVSFLLGPQFRRHAAISRQCSAVVFFVPAGGRQVRVFADGHMMGRYSDGDWSPESMLRVDETVAQLAEEKNYDLALLRRILRCAFQMSENNLGAIFIIGNADNIFEHSDTSEISHIALIVSDQIEHLSDQELINFAKQDGATVLDVEGKFRGCMVLLRPDADTQAEIGPGKGARHSSAAKMSTEAQCLAITVSHDGPITIYDSGQRVLSL
jgi:long-chain acyl-CoA synthetase